MSHFITISRIQVQNANCIAGVTYGFPAITHFLGFIHALSRKLTKTEGITLDGCSVISHQNQIHAFKPREIKDGKIFYKNVRFAQTKNPPREVGKDNKGREKSEIPPPIVEEGKMHMTVSLVIECKGFVGGEADSNHLVKKIKQLCFVHKLAGGVITQIRNIYFNSIEKPEDFRPIRRRLMPGFLLIDRTNHLTEHYKTLKQKNDDVQMLDAWLDFSALKYKAIPKSEDDETSTLETKANWERVASIDFGGWLVPIMIGFQAISKLYKPGEVANTRDPDYPFCFTEAVYSIGEWISPHRIDDFDKTLWRYMPPEDGWYLCKQTIEPNDVIAEDDEDDLDLF